MPGIREAITARPPRGGARALLPLILGSMPDDLRVLAEQLLAGPHSDRYVAEAFGEDGYDVSATAVRNYRIKHKLHRFAG